ncbi:hypothetical protein RclHR1_16330002 [Rhizophagus clarus]|uniref:Uncharacterized protein n=1 Tax=Rhizophagus clarus TaxID=94130 RepID=A0A2Z6QHF8_9GLOM|nr:hypothetical protein RclHR1_16330002 [Rhizophagus clarus]GES97157.1 hypothetical protein RCL_jg7037.t1 [Rhizophagus clarus]
MGCKRNKNKIHTQLFRSQSESASTISASEKGNTICYICDKHFICPCEREGYTNPKKCTCALASYSNTYPISRLLPTNDGCYLVHACSDSCAWQINEQSNAYYRSKNIIFKKADGCSYVPDRAIDAFKAFNKNLCHWADKKGNNFKAMIFDMMNNAIEEAQSFCDL